LETLASNIQNSRPNLLKTKSINNSNIKSQSQLKETSNSQKPIKYNSSSLSRLSNESSSFSTTSSSSASSTTSNNRANSFEYDFDSDFASIDFVLNNDVSLNNFNNQIQAEKIDNNNNQVINKNKNNKKVVNVHHHNLLLNYTDENLTQIKQMRRVFDFFFNLFIS
jgi:hypothetical protein